jgi:hypothetical protein
LQLSEKIASVLAPHLGEHSADSVARHMCAKFEIDGHADQERLAHLRDFLRRGLVLYVGAEVAEALAERCVETVTQPK